MEDIYLKEDNDQEWHSNKVNLSEYFKSFSDSYCSVMKRNNMNLCNIFQSVLGEAFDMDKKEVEKFVQEMSEIEKEFITSLPSLESMKQLSYKKTVESKTKNFKGLPSTLTTNFETQHEKLLAYVEKSDNALQENLRKNPEEPERRRSKRNKNHGRSVSALQENLIQNPQEQADSFQENERQSTLEQADNSQQKCVKDKIKEIYEANTKKNPLFQPSLKISKFRKCMISKQPKYKKNILTARKELLLVPSNEIDQSDRKNLKRGKHFVVSFRIQEPFTQRGEKSRVENFQQEILVLGHQTLIDLRDKIICQSDFQDVRGDVSHDPDSQITELSRDKYKSAMFYFDNTFYTDERGETDYSGVVREWALPRGINVGATQSMGSTRMSDLRIRFGYPYLYMHQGGCEHLVIISDARLLSGKDSLDSNDYPLISRIPRPITKYCFTCYKIPAKWIVVGCERLPENISYMCQKCFKSYNYIGGKKIGNFKAFRFIQKNSLL